MRIFEFCADLPVLCGFLSFVRIFEFCADFRVCEDFPHWKGWGFWAGVLKGDVVVVVVVVVVVCADFQVL